MRLITRTIVTTKVYAAEWVNGEIKAVEPVTISGKVEDTARQMKAVRAKYGKNANIVITGEYFTEEKRAITVEDFMAHSFVVETADSDEGENAETDDADEN